MFFIQQRFNAPRLFNQLELPMLIMQANDDKLCVKEGAEKLAETADSEDVVSCTLM